MHEEESETLEISRTQYGYGFKFKLAKIDIERAKQITLELEEFYSQRDGYCKDKRSR